MAEGPGMPEQAKAAEIGHDQYFGGIVLALRLTLSEYYVLNEFHELPEQVLLEFLMTFWTFLSQAIRKSWTSATSSVICQPI